MDLFQRFKQLFRPTAVDKFDVQHSIEAPSPNNFCHPAQTLVITLYQGETKVGQVKGSLAPSTHYNAFYIYNIETQQDYRRRGIGTRLLQELYSVAQAPMTPLHETSSSHLFWQVMRERQHTLGLRLNPTIYIDEIAEEKARWK